MDKKILLIIPAFNEGENLKDLVININNNFSEYDYIIINDGSTDNTEEICRTNNFNFLNLPANLGIGGCVQTGYLYALQHDYDIAVQLDGDGQHLPEEIYKLIKPIENNEADFVIGSRFLEKDGFQTSGARRFGIRIISSIIKMCCGLKIYDTTSGFRAVNSKCMKLFSTNYAIDYPEPESIVTAALKSMRIIEVPVVMAERKFGVSSINLSKSIYYMIKVSLALIIQRLFNKKGK